MTPASFLMAAIAAGFAYSLDLSANWQAAFGLVAIAVVLVLSEALA